MTDPLTFAERSARFGLPFLFSAQGQKELFVNEAHALSDMLLHPAVEGEANDPPATPADGECWLVGASPTGVWSGHAGALAGCQSGNWLFARPAEGMRIFDAALGRQRVYLDGWQSATDVADPSGGTTVDSEARTAIAGLIAALVANGILSSS